MIFFRNDYSEGAHPAILEALVKTNDHQTIGYGEDEYCREAADLIRARIGRPDADVHFLVGGTQTNLTALSSFLRPHEAVISPARGHICVHETGAIEATGHKIIAMPTEDAKIRPEQIEEAVHFHCDEHMVKPRVVYITNSTELGTIYTLKELEEIREVSSRHGLYLYLDGARLASALTAPGNDVTLEDLARLTDAFYIGGTKNGMLFGEAIVILNDRLKEDFRYLIKQKGGLLAKGRLLGVQFKAAFENDLYFEMGTHANRMATLLRDGIRDLGYGFLVDSPTNQLFPVFPNSLVDKLYEVCSFEEEGPVDDDHRSIRFVTSWATPEADVHRLLEVIRQLG
jgi:threonine aldolase